MPDRRLDRPVARHRRKRWFFDGRTIPPRQGHGRGNEAAEQHERLTLIEFIWVSPTGVQPVLFMERELLQ